MQLLQLMRISNQLSAAYSRTSIFTGARRGLFGLSGGPISALNGMPLSTSASVTPSKLDSAAATAIRRQLRALPKSSSEKPKGPITSYILFSNEKRAQVAASPEFANVEKKDKMTRVTKQLGALWRAAPEAEKKKYQALAEASKVAHAKALAAYTAKRSPEDVILDSRRRALQVKLNPNRGRARVTRDPNAPKRPASAYILFLKTLNLKGGRESIKEAATKWKALSAAAKQPFTTQAAKLAETYKVEKDAYDKKNGVDALRKVINKDLAKAVRIPKKKKKVSPVISGMMAVKVVVARRSAAPKKTKTVSKKKPVKKAAAPTKKSTTLKKSTTTKKTAVKASSKKPVSKTAVKKTKVVAKKITARK
ncbi:high mobility group box 3 [Chytriomyces hyalinus]|nr:high mobility group box 3 [Chytriomyces hyalinus]